MSKHTQTSSALSLHSLLAYPRLILDGMFVGVFSGLLIVLFRKGLTYMEFFRKFLLDFANKQPLAIFLWVFVLLLIATIILCLVRFEPFLCGSGIPHTKGELSGKLTQSWWNIAFLKPIACILTLGSGLSLGREGPSIQIGSMVGKGVAKITKRESNEEQLLVLGGASAGLSAAFHAPLAGILFSLEELRKGASIHVLLSTLSASITAYFVSCQFFGTLPIFSFAKATTLLWKDYWILLILGIIVSLFGALYNRAVAFSQTLFSKINPPFIRIILPFLLTAILGLCAPMLLGGGHDLVEQIGSFTLGMALILLLAKFLFSLFCIGSGVPGGIFLPLLVLGATLGVVTSYIGKLFGATLPTQTLLILGMAGLFIAVTRLPLTGTVLMCELIGSYTLLLPLCIVAIIAYVMSLLLGNTPIYSQMLGRLLTILPRNSKQE